MRDLTIIFRTSSQIEADVITGLLETHGIEVLVSSDLSRTAFPFSSNELRLSVSDDEAVRAQQIIGSLDVKLLGVVLTQVPLNTGGDYGYYTNNYAYYSEQGGKKDARQKVKSDRRAGRSGTDEGDRLVLREPGSDGRP